MSSHVLSTNPILWLHHASPAAPVATVMANRWAAAGVRATAGRCRRNNPAAIGDRCLDG